jgi:hypothetical protein
MRRLFALPCAVAVVTALATLSPVEVEASTVLYADLPELSRHADAVIRGTVVKQQSRWSGDGMRIFTDVEIRVEERIAGQTPEVVIVRQPGGIVGDIGQRVAGLASFEPGEEVVVFLEARPRAVYLVAGMSQGKYRVERSRDGKKVMAVPERGSEARLIDPKTRQERAARTEPVELDELRRQVRRAAAEKAQREVAPPQNPDQGPDQGPATTPPGTGRRRGVQ